MKRLIVSTVVCILSVGLYIPDVMACPCEAPVVITPTATPNPVNLNSEVEFLVTASDGDEPYGTVLSYSWDFGPGAYGVTYIDGNERNPKCKYNTPGSKTVTVTVSDCDATCITHCTESHSTSESIEIIVPLVNPCYVSVDGNDVTGDGTEANPLATIQYAIDLALDGHEIIVIPGTYYEQINFHGKPITVHSTDPNDWLTVGRTIIHADDPNVATVSFGSAEDANSVLDGLKISGGLSGIECDGTSPVIQNCIIAGNGQSGCYTGGGVYDCNSASPLITNCFIVDNEADYGAGLYNEDSSPVIRNCVISKNYATYDGGGLYDVNSVPEILNCTFIDNDANNGGGMYCIGSLSDPNVVNSIFWDNEAVVDSNQIYNNGADPNFRYCDIQGSNGSGGSWDTGLGNDDGGNIDDVPCFITAEPDVADLVSYWKFDETGGSTAYDSFGNNDGTLVNDPNWVHGIIGNALDFDGDDYVAADAVCGDIEGKNVTLTAWIKAETNSSQQFICAFNTSTGGNRLLLGQQASDSDIAIHDAASGGWKDSGTPVFDGTWHHVAFTLSTTNNLCTLFVDGQSVYPYSTTTSIDSQDLFSIGQKYDLGDPNLVAGDFFDGVIDDVRIYDTALTAADVNDLFEYGLINQYKYQLAYNSPCRNAGDSTGVYTGQVDIDGENRVIGGRVDIGADEESSDNVIYVDINATGAGTGVDWENAYTSIQTAINNASGGEVILVAEGTYTEAIDFGGNDVWVTSVNPNDPNVVANTIIDANSVEANVVYFHTGEDANSILDGFTVTGGTYGVYCEGTSALPVSPVIRKCMIQNNSSHGINIKNYTSPLIEDCLITENTSYGVYVYGATADAQLLRCQINENGGFGVYVYRSGSSLQNCVIANNNSYGIVFTYYYANNYLSVDHCTIVGNTTYGLFASSSTTASQQMTNSILWDNDDDLYAPAASSFEYSYCCIEDMDEGTGIIHSNPLFLNASGGDYHLGYGSQCLTADDEGGNLGAYGGTSEATVIDDPGEDGLSDDWQEQYWPGFDPEYTDPNSVWAPLSDPDGDGLRNKDEYYLGYDPSSNDGSGGQITTLVLNERLDVKFPSIAQALDFAKNGDTLTAAQATYYESIDFNGKSVYLRSSDPNDSDVVSNTIIDANSVERDVVYFHTGEDANSILEGFAVTGGTYGVYCEGTSALPVSPEIRNCIIEDNSTSGVYLKAYASPMIKDCVIRENTTFGVYVYGSGSDAQLLRCQINDNDNYGVYNARGSTSMQNCVIANNGGFGVTFNYYYAGDFLSVDHCTIVGNTTYGLYISSSQTGVQEVTNSILWDNDDDLSIPYANLEYSYCCIEDVDEGTGVVHSNPLFVNRLGADYHLGYGSQCLTADDEGGNLGAYGGTSEATVVSDPGGDGISDDWQEQYWPTFDPDYTDPNSVWAPNSDPDADGLSNKDEYYLGTDPTENDSASGTDEIETLVLNQRLGVKFPSISQAIDFSQNGDTLTAAEATYYESIDFNGKSIDLTSSDPSDPNVVAGTVIDGNSIEANVVYFHTGEDANSILDGFTVTGGASYGIYCEGTSGSPVSPVIQNCIIQHNGSSGVYLKAYACPMIKDCMIRENTTFGVYVYGFGSDAQLLRCQINNNDNYGVYNGRGSTSMQNCVIANNGGYGVTFNYYYAGDFLSVDHCTIVGNTTYGLYVSSSAVASQQMTNSILWDNDDDLYVPTGSSFLYSYCCIEDMDEGTGVVHLYPMFQDPLDNPDGEDGIVDYHLRYVSPLLTLADDGSELGAYGNTDEETIGTDTNSDGLADAWQTKYWPAFDPNDTDPNAVWLSAKDPDGDGLRNKDECYLGYDPTVNNSDDGMTQITTLITNERLGIKFPSINHAFYYADDLDTLVAAQAIYYGTLDFEGRPFHLQSEDPDDPNIVANTIIDGNSLVTNVVDFHTGEDSDTILDGFTVTGGTYGIYCNGTSVSPVSPLIRNCIIQNNSSHGIQTDNYSLPQIEDCVITKNSSYGVSIGGYGDDAQISHCQISGNGRCGIYVSSDCSATVENCLIAANNTDEGNNNSYGIYLTSSSWCLVDGCTIVGHTDSGTVYGVFGSGNYAGVRNSILWDNDDDLSGSQTISYSCVQDNDDGAGVIHADPLFADPNNGDYHLKSHYGRWDPATSSWVTDPNQYSPCVDAGTPGSDYSNEPNTPTGANGGRVNMGAYGNTQYASKSADSDSDGLSDTWEMRCFGTLGEDPNGNSETSYGGTTDDFTNSIEYLFNYDPTEETDVGAEVFDFSQSASTFDPTIGQTVTFNFLLNKSAKLRLKSLSSSDIFFEQGTSDNPMPAGQCQIVWDGTALSDDLIIEDGTYQWQLETTDALPVELLSSATNAYDTIESIGLTYGHIINGLYCNPKRIIPVLGEVMTISYDFDVSAALSEWPMTVNVYDPNGILFRTVIEDDIQSAGTNSVVWYGKNGPVNDPNSRYPSEEGEYTVEVEFSGMREDSTQTINVYK